MSNKLVFTVLLFATVLLIPASSFSNSPSHLIIEKFVSSVYAQKESSFNSNMAFQLSDLKTADYLLLENISQSESFDSSELNDSSDSSESSELSTTETESITLDSDTDSTTQSSSTQSNNNNNNNMITSSYFADKDNVQYSYHYPLKNKDNDDNDIHKQIKECTSCFISELKKLDDKQLADQILKEIKNEFGDITNLCKLILNEDIDRDQLENILYSILFGNQDHYNNNLENKDHRFSDTSNSYYYDNNNQYESNDEYEKIEKQYQNENEENNYSDEYYYDEYYNEKHVVYSYPSIYYEDEYYYDDNYYKNSQKDIQYTLYSNYYDDKTYKFIDAKLKNNFIQNVLECLFQPPIIYVVWTDTTPGNRDIFFSFSDNNGLTFSQPENISNNDGDSIVPQIATYKDSVYTVWLDGTPGNNDIFFSFSDNNGLTFSQPENISNNDGFSASPQITTNKDKIYIVWTDDTPGNNDIFFSFSDNNGLSFSQPENISNNDGRSLGSQITTDKDDVYIVWRDDTPGNLDIFFSFSDNNGLSFSQPENISNNDGDSGRSNIATDKDNIYIVWQDDTPGNNEIFFSFSDNNGLSFSQPENISNNDGLSESPQIAIDKDKIYVVWVDNTPDNRDIFFSFSDNNGFSFSQPDNISNNDGDSFEPKMATNKDDVYIVWTDITPGNLDIFFSFSDNNGFSFSQPDNISNNDGFSASPQIDTNTDNIYIVWQDDTPGNEEISFSFSDNNGLSFSQPDNISNNDGSSTGPQIVTN